MEIWVAQSVIAYIYLTTPMTKLIRSEGQWLWQLRNIHVSLENT